MKRFPIVATVLVVAAVATMIALGVWQIERAAWKDRLIAEYAAAAALPALDLDPLLARDGADLPPLAFRRVLVTCRAHDAVPDQRGGSGGPGYSYFVACRPGTSGLAGRLIVNVGWSPMPDHSRRITLHGIVAGTLGPDARDRPLTLISATAAPGLAPSAAPTIDQIPDNHMSYAFTWFFFAAAAAVIYGLALRRRRAGG